MAGESTADQTLGGTKLKETPSKTWGEQRLERFGYSKQQLIDKCFECKNIEARGISYGVAFSLKPPDSDSFRGIERVIVVREDRVTLTASRYKRIPREIRWGGPGDEELRPESVEFTVFNPRLSSEKKAELKISSLGPDNYRSEVEISVDKKGYADIESLFSDETQPGYPKKVPVNKENKSLILVRRLGFSSDFSNGRVKLASVDAVTKALLKLVTEGPLDKGPIFDPQVLKAKH